VINSELFSLYCDIFYVVLEMASKNFEIIVSLLFWSKKFLLNEVLDERIDKSLEEVGIS